MLKAWTSVSLICLLYSGVAFPQSTETAVVSTTSNQIGFNSSDFTKLRLQFYIYWRGLPKFSNFQSYWVTSLSQCHDSACGSQVLAGPTKLRADDLEFHGRLRQDEQKFQSSSIFVNLDNATIKRLASFINGKKFSSLKEKIRAIIAAEATVLKYPDDSAFYPKRSTDEILSQSYGRVAIGECKSFANVFVSLARATGIPARIVNGFMMSPYGLQGHAWAEVKTDREIWVPIDPQTPNAEISPLYIPTGIDSESFDEAASDNVIEILKQD